MNRSIQTRFGTLVGSMILLLSLVTAAPAKADAIAPCAIDLSQLQDPRISDDLRRKLQTDLYLYSNSLIAQRKPLPIPVSYEVEKSDGNTTYAIQVKNWPINCGIYLYLSKRKTTYRSTNGTGTRTEEYTDLYLGNLSLFDEHIDTAGHRSLRQLVSLEVNGPPKLFNTGDRHILREIEKGGFPDPESWLDDCEVTDSRPASTIDPRLTGNVITEHCKQKTSSNPNPPNESTHLEFTDYSYSWSKDCDLEGRSASEFHPSLEGAAVQFTCHGGTPFVWLAEYGAAIPIKPKIEVRNATEFYSNFSGNALVVSDPVTGRLPIVFLPALRLNLEIDTIDPTGLGSNQANGAYW